MSKKMLINATHPEENRVAIVEDGILTELDIEVAGREPTKGNIYKAVVVRVETGLQAAFVDYGGERLGFLQIDEINYSTVKPDYKTAEDGRRPRINELLHRGQEFLVQINKEERGTKGAALTTYLSLAGRYMVLMPGSQTRGVSRKAESDAQRKELKKAMSSIDLAEGIGYIVRTAALDQTREELERDYRYLIRLFESIQELDKKAKGPALIYKESNLMIRSIRDYFTTDMDEVLVDDAQVFKEAKDFFQMVMPDQVGLVKLHQERRPIFSRYQIEDQIETLSRNKVALPSGGSIVIDPTEALVAIDVNSGKMASEQGVEATATKTNLEAATEVGRQLRLRDLGGLIVIDFIDMRERKNMRQVENLVKKSLENDKARVSIGRISKFGLLELSRQRIKATLTQGSHLPCPHCNGTGQLKSPETQAVSLLRKIHASAAKGQVGRIDAQLPIEVAAYLLNYNREELVDMERRYQLQIHIHGNRDFLADQVEIEIQKKEKEKAVQAEYVEAATLPMATEEATQPVAIEQESDEPVQQESAEAEAEAGPGKKRRRRRRRKPAGAASTAESQTADATIDTGDESPVVVQDSATEAVASDDQEESPVAVTAEETENTAPTKRPQRRRRSSSKAKAAVTESEETTAEPVTTEALAAEPAEAEASDDQTGAETRPKRRRSRRKPKAALDSAQSETAAETEEQSQRETTTPVEQSAAAEPETKSASVTKPARPRRTAKQPQAAQEATETPQTKATEQVMTVLSVAAEKPAAKKPARPGRKKSETTAPAQESTPVTIAAPPAETLTPTAAATEEKPKRPRVSRAKPKVKAVGPEAEATLSKEVKPAIEKPVKKAAAPRTTKKAPAKNDKAAADSAQDAQAPVAEKPKRTRVAKKKPTDLEPSLVN